jgi:hypothetical protein
MLPPGRSPIPVKLAARAPGAVVAAAAITTAAAASAESVAPPAVRRSTLALLFPAHRVAQARARVSKHASEYAAEISPHIRSTSAHRAGYG